MAVRGNAIGGKGSQEQTKESETAPLPLLRVPQDCKAYNQSMYAENLVQSHTSSMLCEVLGVLLS